MSETAFEPRTFTTDWYGVVRLSHALCNELPPLDNRFARKVLISTHSMGFRHVMLAAKRPDCTLQGQGQNKRWRAFDEPELTEVHWGPHKAQKAGQRPTRILIAHKVEANVWEVTLLCANPAYEGLLCDVDIDPNGEQRTPPPHYRKVLNILQVAPYGCIPPDIDTLFRLIADACRKHRQQQNYARTVLDQLWVGLNTSPDDPAAFISSVQLQDKLRQQGPLWLADTLKRLRQLCPTTFGPAA